MRITKRKIERMEKKRRKRTEKWILDNLTFQINPKPGFDVFTIYFYFCNKHVGDIEIDGIELEMKGFK